GGGRREWRWAVDKSTSATNQAERMEMDYGEVVEIEEKDENLKKQKAAVDELIELTAKERAAVVRGLPLMEQELARLETAREEAAVLARARLRPDAADELLRAYQTKTGRLLPKPIPLGGKDK